LTVAKFSIVQTRVGVEEKGLRKVGFFSEVIVGAVIVGAVIVGAVDF